MSYANSDGATGGSFTADDHRKKEKETIRVVLRNVSGLSAGTGRQGRQAMHTDCRELFVDTM